MLGKTSMICCQVRRHEDCPQPLSKAILFNVYQFLFAWMLISRRTLNCSSFSLFATLDDSCDFSRRMMLALRSIIMWAGLGSWNPVEPKSLICPFGSPRWTVTLMRSEYSNSGRALRHRTSFVSSCEEYTQFQASSLSSCCLKMLTNHFLYWVVVFVYMVVGHSPPRPNRGHGHWIVLQS